MKLFTLKIKLLPFTMFILSCLFLSNNVFSITPGSNPEEDQKGKDENGNKFLFVYKYPGVKNDKDHKLNIFSFKNIVTSESQIIIFGSTNEVDPSPDEIYDKSKYLLTIRYENLDTPCLNRVFICSHAQFSQEYKTLYSELDFNLPKEIAEKFEDPQVASEKCLLLFMKPVMSVNEAAWICHTDLRTVLNFQVKLSDLINDANSKSFDFVASYIQNKNTIIPGVMTLEKDKFEFNDMNKKTIISSDWKDVDPYALALYLKEDIDWKGPKDKKPEAQRCLKILRSSELLSNNADYFCVYFQKNDITMKLELKLPQSRLAVELYTNKINIRVQNILVKRSLYSLAKINQSSLEVDDKILLPIKFEVRRFYFKIRHDLVNAVKLGEIKKSELTNKLVETKDNVIDKICGGIEICRNALNYCVDKGLLPLKGIREKFAMDPQNPYNRIMPKINIKIDLPKFGSVGKAILSVLTKIKGTKDYFAKTLPESPVGQVPNFTILKKAYNTVTELKDRKEYTKFTELKTNCKPSNKHDSNNLSRKISFLMYYSDGDLFFDYLGYIRNFQFTKK